MWVKALTICVHGYKTLCHVQVDKPHKSMLFKGLHAIIYIKVTAKNHKCLVNNLEFYHTYVVMLFRSKTSILYYFRFLYKFCVLYHSKCIGK